MRIEAISLYALHMPRKAPFQTSKWTEDATEHILVRVDAEGVTGWGEVPCERVPWYHPETVQSCWHVLREFLIPDTLGRDLQHPSEGPALWEYVRGNQFAKSGLDQALWDAYAPRPGESRWPGCSAVTRNGSPSASPWASSPPSPRRCRPWRGTWRRATAGSS